LLTDRTRTRSLLKALLLLGLSLPATLRAADPAPADSLPSNPQTQGIMHGIFDAISAILPSSFDPAAFGDQKNHAMVSERLKLLVEKADELEKHAKSRDQAFGYMARSFGRDAKNLKRLYELKQFDHARFVLHNMTENCIHCHSTLPEKTHFPGAERFLTKIDTGLLSPEEKARLLVMSRQFDEALNAYEGLLLGETKGHPFSYETFVEYLRLCINVRSNLTRPQGVLKQIAARPQTPVHVKQQMERWLLSLKELDKAGALTQATLAQGREIISRGKKVMEFPRDQDGMIHYLVANAILSRYVASPKATGANAAEAYYLLGITETLMDQSFWVSLSEFYLETAIRMAPGAPFAPKAYALLEENYITGYSGSSGTHLPEDVEALLKELRQLVEAESKKAKT